MSRKTLIALTVATFLTPLTAFAGFVPLDWKTENDYRAVLHEESGTEWLKLGETGDWSTSRIQDEVQTGGLLSGWRVANSSEVYMLLESFFTSGISTTEPYGATEYLNDDPSVHDKYIEFSQTFGRTWNADGHTYSYGLYENEFYGTQGTELLMAGAGYSRQDVTNQLYMEFYNFGEHSYNTFSRARTGVWLISDGGATLTTSNDMSLMSNNPKSTYYTGSLANNDLDDDTSIGASDVPVGTPSAIFGVLGLGLLGVRLRTRKHRTLNK